MPTEIRRMMFTLDELECLIGSWSAEGCSALPEGKVIDVRMTQSEPVVIGVTIQQPDGHQAQRKLDSETIVSLMAYFYKQNGIPMPRKAQKTVKINKHGNLVFDIALRVMCPQEM